MNAPHPIMQKALSPFAPKEITEAEQLLNARRLLRIARENEESLLRLPFEIEIEVQPATHLSEAQYEPVRIDDDIVREAADWLIDQHIDELECKAIELQRARWDEQREGA